MGSRAREEGEIMTDVKALRHHRDCAEIRSPAFEDMNGAAILKTANQDRTTGCLKNE
jgi:hypothetical protein